MTPSRRSTAYSIVLAAASLAASLLGGSAAAQQPADPPAVDVPPMTCANPGNAPIDRQGAEMGRFTRRLDEYKLCVNQYTKTTGAKANELSAQARAYTDAANKAIDDYNTYVTGLNEAAKAKPAAK